MTNLPDAKAKQLPISGSTSLGSPLATTAPKTVTKDGTPVVRPAVAPPKSSAATSKKAAPAAKKPAAKKPAAKSTPTKATSVKKATSAKKPAAKKPAAKKATTTKAAAKPAAKKAVAKKTTTTKAAAKPAAKKPVAKKAAAKPAAKKAVAKKVVAKKPAAKKPVAKKAAAKPAAKKAVAKKVVAKKAPAKKPVAKKTTSTRVKAASMSLGEQVFKRVEEVIATGKTAKDAFGVVAKERKMTTSNIQQHYYRFKRKATPTTKKASASSRKTMSKVQGKAMGAAASAVGKLPAKQRKQVAKGVVGATAVGKEIRDDLSQVLEEMFASINEVLAEARKNPQFKKVEKKLAMRFSR